MAALQVAWRNDRDCLSPVRSNAFSLKLDQNSSFAQWLAPRMNPWDRYSSRNHQIESTSRTEPELSSNARQEETPNRISFGFVLTEALLGMFPDSDRYRFISLGGNRKRLQSIYSLFVTSPLRAITINCSIYQFFNDSLCVIAGLTERKFGLPPFPRRGLSSRGSCSGLQLSGAFPSRFSSQPRC